MKKLVFAIFCTGMMCLTSAFSQNSSLIYDNPKYGPDSASRMECANNLSTMSEFMKINLYDYALPSWREVFHECPASSKNIYLYGVRIYREKITKEQDDERKQQLIDTLMMIYDRRIEHFKQEGNVLGRKGIDLLRYRSTAIEEAYGYLHRSVELSKNKSEEAVIVTLMQTTNALYKGGKLDGQVVIDNYLVCAEILDKRIKSGQGNRAETALQNVEAIFSESGAASCEDLTRIFTPKFEETPEDIEFLKKLTTLLQKQKCEDAKLFADASENLYSLEQSSQSAYFIAKLFVKKENFVKAAEYYNEAIKLEEDPEEKASFLYQLALIEFSRFDQKQQARQHARDAIQLKPNWGSPYILIGNIYASSSKECGSNEFEQGTIFWVAVDKFIKAKSVDESVTEEANELINRYSQYFPDIEEAFFYGFQDGKDYTVECWINESTTVRTRSN